MYQHKKIIFYFSVMTLIILLPVCILLIGELDKRISEYKSNIITEIRDGKIIDNNKDVLKKLFLENIKYETAIRVGDEVVVSNDKEIYYEALDRIGEEVKVEIENNKNTGSKSIVDIK
ncbi:MAG: hypothetical protein IJ086_01080 [Clostridium sp.]|nr:hypothetical protein [Clostridium sp.]